MSGYFGIGIYKGKIGINLGTLWRSAYQMGASFLFTIAHRYKKQCSDTVKAYRHLPVFTFDTFDNFKNTLYDCQIICVEFNDKAKKISTFEHPKRCVYLLGAEDGGLPKEIYEKYTTIELPHIRQPSFNVAVAGSIIMYDRVIKLGNN